MPTFVFWNIQKKPLAERVARIAAEHAVDVVVLAECELDADEVVTSLNRIGFGWSAIPFVDNGIRVFSRLCSATWNLAKNDAHWSIYRIESSLFPDVFLATAHLISVMTHTPEPSRDQELGVRRFIEDIRKLEEPENGIRQLEEPENRRTIIVGDLNMDPFEYGAVGADMLHGLMSQDLVQTDTRMVQDRKYHKFYNPMWGLFGDRTPGPPGTYFAGSRGVSSYFWHLFDQVLVRPALMSKLDEVRILDSDGFESLLKKSGRPDDVNGSDHLPILFRIDLN